MDIRHLKAKSRQLRREILQVVSESKSPHVGSMLSILDVLTYLLYEEWDLNSDNFDKTPRDKLILSKGHSSLALYSILSDKGIIKRNQFLSYCRDGGELIGHLHHKVPGVEASTGSLGHGLPIAAGLALSNKIDLIDRKVLCVMGDGECNEGSVWEALIMVAAHRLRHLIIIIDCNGLQAYGPCEDRLPLERLRAMLRGTGLIIHEADGHDFHSISGAFKEIKDSKSDMAHVILAHTVKGKGVSFMENRLEWHYLSPTPGQLRDALVELE